MKIISLSLLAMLGFGFQEARADDTPPTQPYPWEDPEEPGVAPQGSLTPVDPPVVRPLLVRRGAGVKRPDETSQEFFDRVH